MWYASSCSGTTISTGVSSGCDCRHLDQEILRRIEQARRMLLCPAVVSAITDPPRAFASWMLPIIFSNT